MRVSFVPPAPPEGLRDSPRIMADELFRAASESGVLLQNALKAASPVVSGTLRASWQVRPPALEGRGSGKAIVVEVVAAGAGGIEALVEDQGARPHFPPTGPKGDPALGAWIRRKFGLGGSPNDAAVRRLAYLIGRRFKTAGRAARGTFTAVVDTTGLAIVRDAVSRAWDRARARIQQGGGS